MGKADQRAFKTLVILISASVCILVIGCICILILTNGVSKEMKLRAELISQLDARRRAEASSNYKSQFLANMRQVSLSMVKSCMNPSKVLYFTSHGLNQCEFDDITNMKFKSSYLINPEYRAAHVYLSLWT